MKKILFLLCALSLWCGVAEASGSRGLPSSNFTRPSTGHDVGLIFYKLLGSQPPYDFWIQSDSRYQEASPETQAQMLLSERTKLASKYATMDLKKAAIIVRTAVQLEVKTIASTVPGEPGRNTLNIKFPAPGAVYFPYAVGDQTIAVIPNGIDLYSEIPVTADEATSLRARLDASQSATLVLEIPPVKADGTKPMVMDDQPQWLLFGEIGFMGLYNSNIEMLWSYQAPNYVMQGQDAILNLRSNLVPDSMPPGGKVTK